MISVHNLSPTQKTEKSGKSLVENFNRRGPRVSESSWKSMISWTTRVLTDSTDYPQLTIPRKQLPWDVVPVSVYLSCLGTDTNIYIYTSGQIIIFHQPRFPWNMEISLTKPPFGVRSCEVAIIWPDTYTYMYIYIYISNLSPQSKGRTTKKHFPVVIGCHHPPVNKNVLVKFDNSSKYKVGPYQLDYNCTYREYNPSYPFIRPFLGVVAPFITSRGPSCRATWRIIPVSKWLITMVSKSPKWGYSPYKWPKWLINRGY